MPPPPGSCQAPHLSAAPWHIPPRQPSAQAGKHQGMHGGDWPPSSWPHPRNNKWRSRKQRGPGQGASSHQVQVQKFLPRALCAPHLLATKGQGGPRARMASQGPAQQRVTGSAPSKGRISSKATLEVTTYNPISLTPEDTASPEMGVGQKSVLH